MGRWEYVLPMGVIKKQLVLRNKVRLGLDGWTSTNTLAITSAITYYMDRNWELGEVPLAINEVCSLFSPPFES
jgi:hypothetical protein